MKGLTGRLCSVLIISLVLVTSGAGSVRFIQLGRLANLPATGALNRQLSSQSSSAPSIASVELFFTGKPVGELIIGTKAKRYSLKIVGQDFDPLAKVVIDGMKTRVSFASSTELDAGLKGGPLMFPGEVTLQVVNPDGQSSNAITLEVVTDPAVLSTATVTPDFGPLGSQVTITGVGFTPKGNHIRLLSRATGLVGVTPEVDSQDGRTIVLSLPEFICPPCSLSVPPCAAPCFKLKPGDYDVFVINGNGMSNSFRFLVSSPAGPIGMWGEQGLAVEVTDTQVTISGACFVGQIPQTLTTDDAGAFNMTGTITPMIGPGGQARPATYRGTISGNTMTLRIVSDLGTLGPFTLTFGIEVHIVHPCA